jgi:2-(1,2-epoxy-1,2-dihydrophenyl)acetyl-CoA isomerase
MRLETLHVEVEGDVGILTLDRPDARNAMNPQMGRDLVRAASWLAYESPLRALVFTGAGPAFCAGGDLRWFSEALERDDVDLVREVRKDADVLHQAVADFDQVPYPIIAAVGGPAIGAGFSLALMCDLRIAAEDARFGCGYGGIGASPDGGMSYFLPRIVGRARALELLLEDAVMDAESARAEGIVSAVVPREGLLDAALERARALAAKPEHYVRSVKRLLRTSLDSSLGEHLQAERHLIAHSMGTTDLYERVTAFARRAKG